MLRIRELRKNKKISPERLADMLGISMAYLYDLEKGRRRLNAELLNKLCDIFEVSSEYLLDRSDNPHPEQTPFDYSIIYQQRDEGDAYLVVRELERKYHLSKDTVFKMFDDIAEYYKERSVLEKEGKLADGPKSPGSGVFDNEDGDGDG